MIITLRGTIIHKLADAVVLEVGGVGYEIRAPQRIMSPLVLGAQAAFWIHDHVREDNHDLFGFTTEAEFRMFRGLINVSGVGPKTALAALGADAAEVARRIDNGDAAWLSTIQGVGKKTAQKIVLELKGKLVDVEGGSDDLLGALVSMGYRREEASAAAQQAKGETLEERLRHSLKALAR